MAEKKLEELYPSNSKMPSKTATHQVPKLKFEGTITQKKKTIGRRLSDAFIGQDVVDVKSFMFNDVFIPATKNIVLNILEGFCDSIELALFGTSKGRVSRQHYGYNMSNTVVSYSPYWNGGNKTRQNSNINYVGRSIPKDLIFSNNAEALNVLNNLCDMIDTYGAVSVSELNEMLGEPTNFTDQDWGWTNLSSASVRAVRGGYLLDLPKIMPLK